MSVALAICSVLALFTAAVHAWLGGREVLRPVLAADLRGVVRGTMEAAWHLLTFHFVVLGALFGYGASKGGQTAELASMVGGASALGFAAIFLFVTLRRFGSLFRLPQWTLFLPMGVLAIAAPWLQHAAIPTAGHVAAGLAALGLSAIALLHVAWAMGATWPAKDRFELGRLVVGEAIRGGMPGRTATILVAIGLLGAAAWVLALRGLVPLPVGDLAIEAVAWALVGVFALRGLGGFFEPAIRPGIRSTPYMLWNARLYSPIALVLALTIGIATATPL